MYKSNFTLYALLVFLTLFIKIGSIHAQENVKKEILILHAYHENLRWTEDVNMGMKSTLSENLDSYELAVEYMDLKRHNPEETFPYLKELYQKKYKDKQLQVILSSDNSAFDFLKLYGDELFPGVPVFFCGLNNFEPAMLEGVDNFTGVLEQTDTLGTVNAMVDLIPSMTHVAAISCDSPSGILHKEELEEIEDRINGDTTVVYLHSLTPSVLESALDNLPPTSAILFLSYYYDSLGNYRSNQEALTFIQERTDLPVFSLWDYYVEWNVVGGLVTSGTKQGHEAALLAIDYLNGVPLSELPIVTDSSRLNEALFNYNELHRYHLEKVNLPESSRILFEPDTFYTRNKGLVWAVLIIFMLLLTLVLTMFVDLSRRMKLEKELKQQERILSDTLNHIPLIVYWKDKDDRIMGSNNSFKISQETHSINLDWISPIEKDVKSGGRAVFFKELEKSINKTKTTSLLVTVIPVEDMDSPLSLITLIQDISEQKKMEIRLKQSGKMESLGRISGGIAHDFNNLLAGIVGAADLILQCGVNPEIEGYLSLIFETSDRAHELITGLLSYARKAPLNFTSLSLSELMKSTISILERTIDKTVKIELVEIQKDMMIYGDKSMLQSSLMNLGINAKDAMKGKKGKLTYKVSYREGEKPMAQIDVIDEGEGIEKDVIEKIFEPFYTTKNVGEGTGLGLAGVYGCVKSHRGTISVDSEKGKGSIFTILLPLVN